MMINRAIPERFKCKLNMRTQDIVVEKFMKFFEGNVSDFQKKNASGALAIIFPHNR